ncbi:hypothetical protein [Actinoplanes derwentensis]|uniref:hypothetical protein n=1 Tax=Actinoplanes derwentensis TaxID=113562 RepID=UPI00155F8981|nr:hypothetical protein [Actinoplanes derwentensis]
MMQLAPAKVFNLDTVARLIRMMGVNAIAADSGSGIEAVFVGVTADEYGTPRYTVLVGPGQRCRLNGEVISGAVAGEVEIVQDTVDVVPVYRVRDTDTEEEIAQRAAALHHEVVARRAQREKLYHALAGGDAVDSALNAFWDHVTQTVFPRVHNGANDAVTEQALRDAATNAMHQWLTVNFSLAVPQHPEPDHATPPTIIAKAEEAEIRRCSPGAISFVSSRPEWPGDFQKVLHAALSRVIEERWVISDATVYAGDTGSAYVTKFAGQITSLDTEAVQFADGTRVLLDEIVAVTF